MRALIAAGGRATRLRPISHTLNKHLLPLANKPMLEYAIIKLVEAGITEIIINVNLGDVEISSRIGDGSRYGAQITYLEQQGGALGIAHAVNNARAYLSGEPFVFYLGDNVMAGSIKTLRHTYESEGYNAMIALARVKDPNRFGVPEFDITGKLVRAHEKPENPSSPFAITGLYFFDDKFFEAFKTMKPSARGEYEITDIITWFIQNARIGTQEITGWWKDTGTPDALLEGNALLLDEMHVSEMKNEGELKPGASIQGKVCIGRGTVIGPEVLVRGPVIIGENCKIDHAYIGPYTSIGDGVLIQGPEIEHSIIMENAKIFCSERITDSIIGAKAAVNSSKNTMPRGHRLVLGDNSLVEL